MKLSVNLVSSLPMLASPATEFFTSALCSMRSLTQDGGLGSSSAISSLSVSESSTLLPSLLLFGGLIPGELPDDHGLFVELRYTVAVFGEHIITEVSSALLSLFIVDFDTSS